MYIYLYMKIIISENQIKLLKGSLLLESDDDLFTYTTKYDQKLYSLNKFDMLNYLVWQNVPKGTKFKFSILKIKYGNHIKRYGIYAWNGLINFNCNGDFDVVKEGKGYIYRNDELAKVLKNKFCSGDSFKAEIMNLWAKQKTDKDTENNLSKIQDLNCLNKIKVPYKNAVNWWKNKLNEPAFYSKLKKLNKYTDQQTKEWINKYKNYLTNNISGPFCPTKSSKWHKENLGDNTIARLAGNVGTSRLIYNVIYKDKTSKEIEATMVHEIQHAFYDLKPMTPDSNWKKVFPYKVWSGSIEQNSDAPSSQEKSTISKYGLNQGDIKWWKEVLKDETDIGYVCRITELASRVVKMKNLLNYKTNQKITVDDFKKFIEHNTTPYDNSNAYYIVLCWVYNGMGDIQTFINNLDKYVVAKVDTKNNDNMKDGVS